jgi:acyl carrier protein
MEEILKIFNTVLKSNNKSALNSLSPKTRLREDIGLDSLSLAELTVRIEAEYGIDIFEDGMVFTVGGILKKLEKNG